MTKQDFIDNLEKDDLTIEAKIEVCQFYIDNYPVVVTISNIMGNTRKYTTTLKIKIEGGSDNAVNHAFNQLKKRIDEFKLS